METIETVKISEAIDTQPEDSPYSSFLILEKTKEEPLHVVAAMDEKTKTCHVVTIYLPDPAT